MPRRELEPAAEPLLRCDHCGRSVRETQHTRSSYTVDYYSVFGGAGEVCSFIGDDGQRGATYVKLLDPRQVTSCVQCYHQAAVQAERNHCFQPERTLGALRRNDS
jgi:hypothetical protein